MPNDDKTHPPPGRRLLLATGIACAACCAVPVVGVVLGSTAIAGLAFLFERLAIVLAIVGAAALLIRRRARQVAATCEIEGACDPRSARTETTEQA